MKKVLSLVFCLVIFIGCGSEFPGQPSDVVRIQQTNYPDGNLKEEIPYNKESRIHGVRRSFYPNGQLEAEENYQNGKKEGAFKQFYESGQLLFEGNHKNNLIFGKFKTYYPNGNLEEEGDYLKDADVVYSSESGDYTTKNGDYLSPEDAEKALNSIKFTGNYKKYYENGNIEYDLNFNSKGNREGIQKTYNEDGSLESEESYKDGKKDGVFRYYKNGGIVKEEEYKNGVLVTKKSTIKNEEKNVKNFECNNPIAIKTLKEEFPNIFFKTFYDLSGFKGQGIDYEDFARRKDDIMKHAQIQIHSVSNFQKNEDTCMAFINASVTMDNETRKGVWVVTYEMKGNKIKITKSWYNHGDDLR